MAFIPPKPPSYSKDLPGLFFVVNPFCASDDKACMMYPPGLPYDMTILYSHGNAEDIGVGRSYMTVLSDQLRVNVVSYDYDGYGLTSGYPSEAGCYSSIESVYDHLVITLNIDPSRIIAAGRSLGSGPAIHLASKFPCAGLLLISPLLSALRVVSDKLAYALAYSDIFVNISKIRNVTCPVLIVHGFLDDVIPWAHGSELAAKCPNLWKIVTIPDGNHNNRATTLGAIADIRSFIEHIKMPGV